MKLLQCIFIIYAAFFGSFLHASDAPTSVCGGEELLQYSECPPQSALWPAICTCADIASGMVAAVGPGLVCGILGFSSIHCQISGSVLLAVGGSVSLILTPLAGYMWYEYLQQPKRTENSTKQIALIKALKDGSAVNKVLAPAVHASMQISEELSQKLLLAYEAGYFVYKSELIAVLKKFNKNEKRELKDAVNNNEKIGCLAGVDVSQVIKAIYDTDILALERDKEVFVNLFDQIGRLIPARDIP